MFLIYFALWVILNGRFTPEIGAFGLAFALLLYVFSCAFLGFSVKKDLRLIRGIPAALAYGVLLLTEIVKANFAVMRIILNPAYEVKPKLVRFESGLKMGSHRVALADSITLTPGTITCQLRGDEYVVHCLDESMTDGLTDGPMITALLDMEREKPKKPAQEDQIADDTDGMEIAEALENAQELGELEAAAAAQEEELVGDILTAEDADEADGAQQAQEAGEEHES